MAEAPETAPPPADAPPAATPPAATPPATTKPRDDAKFVKNTLARLATAAVGIPILLFLLYGAPWWLFPAFCLLAILRAAHELFHMTMGGKRLLYAYGLFASVTLAGTSLVTLASSSEHLGWLTTLGSPSRATTLAAALALAVTAIGVLLPLTHPSPNAEAGLRTAWLVAGPLYVGALLASVPALFLVAGGTWVVLAMALAWGSDTGAYFAGRFFGRRKLAPAISPAKTVEGAIGGLAASVFFAVIGSVFFLPELPLAHAVVLAIVANALGQAGDLAESLIKRSTGVKDSGSILPGHGGLLDRIDALMFTATSCLLYRLLLQG